MSIEPIFLSACVAKLDQSVGRIGVCLGKLSDDQIWARGNENENAVGNLVLHLCGNVMQWIVSGLGGAKDLRDRDREFDTPGGIGGAQLLALLTETVAAASAVIGGLSSEQLTRVYQIQTRSVTGVEAVLNVVEHFGQHTGQIIYATKSLTGEDLGLVMPKKAKA